MCSHWAGSDQTLVTTAHPQAVRAATHPGTLSFAPSAPINGAEIDWSEYDAVAGLIGREDAEALRDVTLAVYARAHEIAASKGIILADTKFEFGRDADGRIVLADEVLTPDSSRFWPLDLWEPGHAQPSYDKQFVRDWLKANGLAGDASIKEIPSDVVQKTSEIYKECQKKICGK